MNLAGPDMISNSYFPAEAAVELGFFKAQGLDVGLELIFPGDKAYAALRAGAVAFGARRLPGISRRQTDLRAGARHVLVPGDACGSQSKTGRRFRCQRAQYR